MREKNLGESHIFVFPSSFVSTLLRNTSLPQLPMDLSRGMFYKQPLIGTSVAWGSHKRLGAASTEPNQGELHPRASGRCRGSPCREGETLGYLHSLLLLQCWGSPAARASCCGPPSFSSFSTLLLLLSPVHRLRQGSGLPLGQTQPSKKAISRLDVRGAALWIEAYSSSRAVPQMWLLQTHN